jgi:hypothetical protein
MQKTNAQTDGETMTDTKHPLDTPWHGGDAPPSNWDGDTAMAAPAKPTREEILAAWCAFMAQVVSKKEPNNEQS